MKEVKDYIEQRGWKYKSIPSKRGIQFLIDHCPFCSSTDPTHFYISELTGQYICHRCGERGSFLSLKEHLGDLATITSFKDLHKEKPEIPVISIEEVQLAHEALQEDKDALKWLKHRYFSLAAVSHFKLGLSEEKGQKWIWFPYIVNGIPVNVKKRSLEGKHFLRIVGGESALLNQDILYSSPEEIILTEGESDCVALWSTGIRNVVGTTIGARGVDPHWIDLLDKVTKIYIAYDMDDVGNEGAYELANRLGIEKCYKIELPPGIKDVNEFFQKGYTKDQFKILMEQAKGFHIQYVTSIGDEFLHAIRRLAMRGGDPRDGLTIPWPKVDRLVNGFDSGDLICVAGLPAVGKSTFAINLAYLYSRQQYPVLLFEMEMRPYRIIPGLAALHTGISRNATMQVDILQNVYKELKEFPLFFAYVYKKPNFDFCADTIRKCYNKYGLKFVIFDNLHFLVRDARNQTGEVSVAVQNFKLLAEELGIPILLVARPRKLIGNKRIITNQDLKDSADIEGDTDTVILIHRERKEDVRENVPLEEGIFVPETLIRVSKARWGPGGDCQMWMDDEHCRLSEV